MSGEPGARGAGRPGGPRSEVPGSQPAESGIPYIPALDGIRALAVAAVLAFHGGFPWASGGFLGVSTFFTLSGFLITSLLLGEHEARGRIAILAFWDRRFRRLMPAALAALTIAGLYGATLADADQLWRLRGDTLSSLFYAANWRFLLTGMSYEALFVSPSPVQHFWSLAIEEQFYLVFPLAMAGLLGLHRSRVPLVVVLSIAGCASALWMAACAIGNHSIARAYYGTDTRAFELLVGALLAVWIRSPRATTGRLRSPHLGILGAFGVAISLFAWGSATVATHSLFRGGLAAYSIATAAWIAAVLTPGPLATALSWAPLRGLGRISYGVYLYHWPLFLALDEERTGLDGLLLFALRVAGTLVVAIASYRWLERPIRLGRWRSDRRAWVALPAAAVLVAALQLAVTRDLETPWYAEGAAASFADEPETADLAVDEAAPPGVRGRPVRVIMVGDSVGYTIAHGLREWGRETGRIRVLNHAKIGCSFARGGIVRLREGDMARPERCQNWAQQFPERIARFDPQVVVVMTGVWDLVDRKLPEWDDFLAIGDPIFDDYLLGEYQRLIDILSARGAEVIWLNQPCLPDRLPPRIRVGSLGGTPALSAERVDLLNHSILPRLVASRAERLQVLDLAGALCPEGRYPPPGSRLARLRADGVHFEVDKSLELARWLAPEILGKLAETRSEPPAARGR